MDPLLNDVEIRILGSLIEKELTTPEYYPLSLNALATACNQKNNRDPVTNLDEDAVRQALHTLDKAGLAGPADTTDSRVTKYEHRLQEAFNFDRREIAILCVLFLRGPQTPGELRGRTERMHRFDDLSQVQTMLQRMANREPPLVKMLPRQPGAKEARYAHLLSGDAQTWVAAPETEPAIAVSDTSADRIAHLENEVVGLQKDIAELKQQFAAFRKQFE